MATVEERVAAGAALLDDRRPGWFKDIDCGSLDIASAQACVCGQLFESFYVGIRELDIDGHSQEYGFAVGASTVSEINAAWRDLIVQKRLADVKVPALA